MSDNERPLPAKAAICAMETGIEVTHDGEGILVEGLDRATKFDPRLDPYWAQCLAEALLEAASDILGEPIKAPAHTNKRAN